MKGMDVKKETVTIRAASRDEVGRKRAEKGGMNAHDIDKLRYVEKKLVNKGVQRLERHPADGLPLARGPPKSGHGGKYTWEGPGDAAESELEAAPAVLDEKDPNYVDEEAEEKAVRGQDGLVVGTVEVAKAAEDKEGVARIEVDPVLQPHLR